MSGGHPRSKQLPFWMIWANPIVRRYARSRLRPVGLGVWLLLAVMIAGFIFFTARAASLRGGMEIIDAARIPIIPLMFLQGIILFGLATGQVAGAMTAEADEGVLDYQRLAPMTPLAKVVGYLFGLPIREWVLFAATMPFSIFSMWQGQMPFATALQLYSVFVVAGVLYHLTGLLAGTVMKNRRWAFLSSMGLVFLLYTVIPQAAKFGLVYFKYVTIMPVVEECYPFLVSRNVGAVVETYQKIIPPARFFGLNFPQGVFTLFSQGVLSLVMLWWMTLLITADLEGQLRGWRRARKMGRTSLPFASDPSTGVPWVILMVGMAAWGWHTFTRALIDSRWFPGYDLPTWGPWAYVLVLATGGIGFHALLEGRGKRATGAATIFGGVLPVMVGTVLAVSSERLAAVAVWLFGICPAAWPVFAGWVVVPADDTPRELIRAVPNSFWFWQGVGVLIACWLLLRLRRSRVAIAEKTVDWRGDGPKEGASVGETPV